MEAADTTASQKAAWETALTRPSATSVAAPTTTTTTAAASSKRDQPTTQLHRRQLIQTRRHPTFGNRRITRSTIMPGNPTTGSRISAVLLDTAAVNPFCKNDLRRRWALPKESFLFEGNEVEFDEATKKIEKENEKCFCFKRRKMTGFCMHKVFLLTLYGGCRCYVRLDIL